MISISLLLLVFWLVFTVSVFEKKRKKEKKEKDSHCCKIFNGISTHTFKISDNGVVKPGKETFRLFVFGISGWETVTLPYLEIPFFLLLLTGSFLFASSSLLSFILSLFSSFLLFFFLSLFLLLHG